MFRRAIFLKFTSALALTAGCLVAQQAQILRDAVRPRAEVPQSLINAASGLPVWQGTFAYNNKNYSYVMVGTDPSKGSKKTTVPVYIVPLKFTFSDGTVLGASEPMQGRTFSALSAVEISPIFQSTTWTEGSINVGTTQYIDAYQRANFWSSVSTVSPQYHVVLGIPIVLPEQSYNVPANEGSTMPGPLPGSIRGTISNGFIDKSITPVVFQNFPQITPNSFTIFLTYNTFVGGAYGFHGVQTQAPGAGNTYAYVSYLEPWTQEIDADISTLAHEVAEWVDDPYTNNQTPCGLLEVGDALSANIFTVTLNGYTWHPQDLVFAPWFTYQPSFSVNGWYTFKNEFSKACSTKIGGV